MSHFTTIKTKITDKECLKKSLKELSYNYEENKVAIINHEKKKIKVDLAVKSGLTYDIGFKWNGNTYDVIADWWGIEKDMGIKQNNFVNKVTQRYAYNKTKDLLFKNGFVLAEETVSDKEEIILTVRQW